MAVINLPVPTTIDQEGSPSGSWIDISALAAEQQSTFWFFGVATDAVELQLSPDGTNKMQSIAVQGDSRGVGVLLPKLDALYARIKRLEGTAACTAKVSGTDGTSQLGYSNAIVRGNHSWLREIMDTVSTTDDTPITIASYTLSAGQSLVYTARVHGIESDGTNQAEFSARGSWRRESGGTSAMTGGANGQQTSTVNSFAATAPTLTFALSTNTAQVILTGKAATSIKWFIDIERSIGTL